MSGSGPTINASVLPLGGSVLLEMPGYTVPASGVTSMTLSRAVSGASGLGPFITLYTGAPLPVFIDVGDMLPSPLLNGVSYVYQLVDATGTTQTPPQMPAGEILSIPDGLTELFIRLLQSAINNLTLPPGIKAVQVDAQMPQGGLQALPYVLVNQDLWQQTETETGQDVPNADSSGTSNVWTIPIIARRIWRITVFSRNTKERDFYRDTLLVVCKIILATVFSKIGQDIQSDMQAASGTDAREWEGYIPGFYYADIMLDMTGSFDAQVLTNHGPIAAITVTATAAGGSLTEIEVPNLSPEG